MSQSFFQTMALIKLDIASRCRYENKPNTLRSILKMLLTPGVLCIALFRFQVFFYEHSLRPLAGVLEYINLIFFSVSIDSRAKIGGGLIIIHAHSIYVSQHVKIGNNFIMFHQNSVGFSPFFEAERETITLSPSGERVFAPWIGDNVILGAGASVYGPIIVGAGSKIAVNSALDCSCAEGSVMFGVPARQVSKT